MWLVVMRVRRAVVHPNAKERRKDLDKCRTRFRIYHSATEKIPTLTGPPCISLPFILGAGGPCLRILLLLLTSRDSMFANNHQDVESCARKICGSTVHSLPYTHFVIFDFTFFFPFARCQRETHWTITMKATLGLSRLIHDHKARGFIKDEVFFCRCLQENFHKKNKAMHLRPMDISPR